MALEDLKVKKRKGLLYPVSSFSSYLIVFYRRSRCSTKAEKAEEN